MSLVISWNSTDEFVPEWQRYDVITILGRGAHSTVWLAQDTLLCRKVAIKQFKRGSQVPFQEFGFLSSIVHRGLPVGYELFQERGYWHIVMEAIEGDTLKTYRSGCGGRIAVEEVRAIGVQLAAALDELHRRGILYRDLKPENVALQPNGHVVLVDLGSACSDYSNDAYVTPPYAAPEQRLRLEYIDERADIYALGVVLFELLTGRTSFDMDPMQDEAGEAVRSVCLQMVSQDPAKRPQSMVDVLLMLLRG